ncbi:MAG: hypothetical protein GY932_10940, partial [Arcobacter sp.]|nr:hypothetical protein [Arcobacter sp.]
MASPFIADINNDGLKEIFIFTIFENKILLNCFNPFENKKYIVNKIIDDFHPKGGEEVCGLTYINLMDGDNENINKIIFAFSTGFSLSPRRFYSFDIAKDTFLKSPISNSSFREATSIISKNKSTLFITSTAAVGNCDSNAIYSDQFNWLTVFDQNLNFKFYPIKIGSYPSVLSVSPIKINSDIYIVALNIYRGNKDVPSVIQLYDIDGNKIKEKILNNADELTSNKILIPDKDFEHLFVLRTNGVIEEI